MCTVTPYQVVYDLSETSSLTRGTSLITLYVPSKMNLGNVSTQLTSELSSSQNIKSKDVRLAVQSGIKSLQQKVRTYADTHGHCAPQNGFVLIAGEIESYV